MSIGGVFFLV
ncbi:hypothetical protein F383_09410 [Gossypium arboreum]|uniref:Uncharacterized protein n=1 Tax=Gossypium arboreum TaxID=29729 RepID=A0A0B0NZT3_GOSAR|nr:hypothetical protein F383_09410 [Gossypium arboreum]